jgi:hypothetical protein
MKSLKERDHSQDLETNGKIILKWILGRYGLKLRIGFNGLRMAVEYSVSFT